jgi:hypothetical protein
MTKVEVDMSLYESRTFGPTIESVEGADTEPGENPITVKFLTAGCAIFTVVCSDGSTRYTYKVELSSDGSRYFAGVLTRPDNLTGYEYMGMYDPERGELYITRNSKFAYHAKCCRVFKGILDVVHERKPMPPAPAKLMHAGMCARCGRLLTTPLSIRRGFGPICWGMSESE